VLAARYTAPAKEPPAVFSPLMNPEEGLEKVINGGRLSRGTKILDKVGRIGRS
jgi:hypothetical protein